MSPQVLSQMQWVINSYIHIHCIGHFNFTHFVHAVHVPINIIFVYKFLSMKYSVYLVSINFFSKAIHNDCIFA